MEQLTVKDLYLMCKQVVEQGYGDRKIVISDDNEGNGFHGLFYGLCTSDIEQYVDEIYDSTTTDPNEIVILG